MKPKSDHSDSLEEKYVFLKNQVKRLLEGKTIEPAELFDEEINQSIQNFKVQKDALKESEQKYRSLYENAPLPFQSLNEDGSFKDVNPAWLSTLGYSREEVIGKNFSDFLHPDWKSHFETNFPAFKKRGYVSGVEFKIRHKNGNYLHISFEGCIGTYPDGSFKQTYCVFKDITEQKDVEHTIRENQYYLSKAQEIGKIGTWELDLVKNNLIWTEENYKIFGVPVGTKMNYEKFLNHVHPDDRDYVNKEWSIAVNNREPYDIEHRLLVNNEIKWVREKADIKYDSGGNPVSAIGFTQDITKFKEVENSIKQEKEKFKILADNTFDWEYWIDPDGKYIYLSPACERITGYNPDDFIKNPELLFDITIQEYKEQIQNHYSQISEKAPHTEEFIINNKNGEEVWIEHSCIPVYDDAGTFRGRRGTNKDITARRKAENEILKAKEIAEFSELRFKAISEQAMDGIALTNLEGKYVFVNQSFCKMMGYSEQELLTMKVFDLRADDAENNLFHRILNNKKTGYAARTKLVRKDKSLIHVDIKGSFLDLGNEQFVMGMHHDVTELVNRENELIKSKEILEEREKELYQHLKYLESLNNSLFDVVFTVDPLNREIKYVNKSVERVYGYKQKECIGLNTKFLYSDEKDYIDFGKKLKEAILNNEDFLNAQIELKRKSGEVFTAEISTTFIRNSGEITDILSIVRDVSEKIKYENELIKAKEKAEESEKRFQLFVNKSPTPLAVVDKKLDQIIYWSDSATEKSGHTPKTVNEWFSLAYPNSIRREKALKRFLPMVQIAGKSMEATNSGEYEITCKDGSLLIGEFYVQSIPDYFIITVNDITERKKNEEALKESQEDLKSIAEHGTNMFYKHDVNHQLKYISPQIKDILGYEVEEAMVVWTDLVTDNPINEIGYKYTMKAIETGERQDVYDLELKHKDGSKIQVEVREAPIVKNGKTVEIVGALADVTEKRKTEQALLIAKEKAEESDRLKSAFLANMSHEIRTPMNGILGFSNLLKEPYLSGEQQQHYIEIIQKSGERMLNTVNDIIEISKIETGLVKMSSEKVNINEHLSTLYNFFQLEADKKGLSLAIEKQLSEEDCRIVTDKSKLSSILTNLIKNAIKFTYVGTISFGCEKKGEMLEFYVKDTGVGIPRNRLEAVFNRFEQADIEDTRAFEGSGLGLAISKSYTEMLGGQIWVESAEGKGSTFYFTIPAIKPEPPEIDASKSEKPAIDKNKKLVFLIVEDDEVSKMHLSLLLKDIAENIIDVSNGFDAVETVRNNPDVDIVLMDIRMPKMDGMEATQKIREFNKEIVIIAQTAFALEGDRKKMLDAGCTDYISKPINKEKLIALVQKYS